MIISSKNTKKVAEESKLFCAIFRNAVGSNSTLCQFCTCWVHERCNGIRHKVEKSHVILKRWVPLTINYCLTYFDASRSSASGDITNFICQMKSRDHTIKGHSTLWVGDSSGVLPA